MKDDRFKPTALLGGYLRQIDPDRAVKLARELCSQLDGDPDSFHGGVRPGNVDLDLEGKAVLGPPDHSPAAQRPADHVEYTAPEFFWNGSGSAAADVFSVGLLLYAGCSGGCLPFQPRKEELTAQERADALRRRMKGEAIPAPDGVSPELKKVIEKALAYDPEERYITATEFLSALGRTDEALPRPEAEAAAAAAEETPAAEETVPESAVPEPAAQEDAPAEENAPEAPEAPSTENAAPAPDVRSETPQAPGGEPSSPGGPAPEEDAGEKEAVLAAAAGAAAASAGRASARADAPAASAAHAAVRPSGGAARQVKVRKDFEQAGRARRTASAVPAARRKKKRSKAVPVVAALLALAILGGAGYGLYALRHGDPEISSPFIPAPAATDGPAASSPEPSQTPEPTASPKPSPTPRPSASPRPSPGPTPTANPFTASGGSTSGGTSGGGYTGGGSTGVGSTGGGYTGGGTSGGGYSGGGYTGGGSTGGGYTGGGYSGGGSTGGGYSGGGSTGGGYSGGSGFTVESAGGTVYLTGNQVRVRTGPGTGYGIIGAVSKGDSLTRTGTVSSGWTQVTYNGVTGYVSSQYLTEPATPAPTATAAPGETPAPSDEPSPTQAPEPSGPPEPVETPEVTGPPEPVETPSPYTVVAEDKTYEQAGEAGLAPVASEEDFRSLTAVLAGSGLEYVWIDAEKSGAENVWTSGGNDITAHWADGEPNGDNDLLLLHKNGDSWEFITVLSDDFTGGVPQEYAGRLGYVTPAAE